jgi:CheY-like chemotaxis protein
MNDPARKYEILVVDDSPVYRKLIEEILSGGVSSLSFACSGSEALKAYHQSSPDIVTQTGSCPISLASNCASTFEPTKLLPTLT